MSGEIELRFDHVHLFCTNLAATEKWFTEGLGAEVVRHRTVKGAQAVDLKLGGMSVLVREQQTHENFGPAGPSRFGTDHFGVIVPDLEVAAKELKRRGVEFEVEPYEISPGTHIAFIKGPDQIRIEVLSRNV